MALYFTIDEVETALSIWEELDRRSRCSAEYAQLVRWRLRHGTAALRQVAINLAPDFDAIYRAIPSSDWHDLAFDWDIVPALLDWVDMLADPPTLVLATSPDSAANFARWLGETHQPLPLATIGK